MKMVISAQLRKVSMSDYRLVETTKEVGHAIRKAHPELKVFSCFTEVAGNCIAITAWGFEGCDFPVLQAETTLLRLSERTRFWLCIGNQEEDKLNDQLAEAERLRDHYKERSEHYLKQLNQIDAILEVGVNE